jgi:drug/metabolite transporter (DMT)-like permease
VLVGCGLAWGSTQSLGKIAVSTGYRPFGLLFWQFVLGLALMGLFMAVRRTPLVLTRRTLRFALVVALLGSVLPGITFWTSVERLPAGIMSLLISTVPLMAFPIALVLGQDRFSVTRGLGLLCGLGGVALIALPEAALPLPGQVAFLPLAMLGPLLYAMETNYVQRVGMEGMDPFQAMALVSGLGAVLLLPVALISGQWIDPLVPWGGRNGPSRPPRRSMSSPMRLMSGLRRRPAPPSRRNRPTRHRLGPRLGEHTPGRVLLALRLDRAGP